MTNECGELTFTFEYDTYGKLIARTGPSNVSFRFNGRDGVITDIHNGLLYMRARCYSPELRRFVNADIIPGEISNAVTLNRYAYANGNPVSNVDPFGLSVDDRGCGPTPLEAAYMATHIYDATDDHINVNLGEEFGGWVLDEILINENGFKIGVYKRVVKDGTIDGTIEYTVVNKGSTTKDDWLDNLKQPFGLSEDMMTSISITSNFVNEHKDANITFVGHSKGGGEALANAKATNRNAIVFNPAIPNYEIYGLGNLKYTAKATSYVVTGEILSSAYIVAEGIALNPYTSITPGLWDDFIRFVSRPVFFSKPFWQTEWLPNEDWSPIEDHSMDSVIIALG